MVDGFPGFMKKVAVSKQILITLLLRWTLMSQTLMLLQFMAIGFILLINFFRSLSIYMIQVCLNEVNWMSLKDKRERILNLHSMYFHLNWPCDVNIYIVGPEGLTSKIYIKLQQRFLITLVFESWIMAGNIEGNTKQLSFGNHLSKD